MSVLDGVLVAGTAAYAFDVPAAALAALPSLVLLGVLDGILGDEEERADVEEATDGGTMFDDDGDDLGFGNEDDGADAFDDGLGGDDAFGGGADAFDDFGGVDDGMDDGASVSDLEHRVDQLEKELSSLSSTVSTVKTENEQISESVDDIEENIRKLLDIYKMVTKGVNPFVDQQGPGGDFAAAVDNDTLGLFGEDEPDEEEELDDDVMEADAEEFFDDDFGDDEEFEAEEDEFEAEEFEAEDFDEDEEDDEEFEAEEFEVEELDDEEFEVEEFDEEEDQFEAEEFEEETDDDGAKSFDDLKEEYEEGGGWDEESEAEELDAEEPVETTADEERVDALFEEEQPVDEEPAYGAVAAPEPEHVEPAAEPDPATHSPSPSSRTGTEKPYLRELPPGYVEDLVVLEWIEFLVEESDPEQAYSAITYYERVDWLGSRAADQLRTFLEGHPEADAGLSGAGGPSSLSTDHHTESLRYVARLTGNANAGVLDF